MKLLNKLILRCDVVYHPMGIEIHQINNYITNRSPPYLNYNLEFDLTIKMDKLSKLRDFHHYGKTHELLLLLRFIKFSKN
jgi:hypothetical protein